MNGLDLTLKSVEGFVVMARKLGDIKERMVVLFGRFRELNIKVKPSKLRLGTKVKFRGFQCEATGGEVRIMPDPSRLKAIAELAVPKSKTEVRAFLGMNKQLEAWSPDLSFCS